MTMILTCLTKNFIVQASDRRLTTTNNGRIQVFDDQSNKALIYANQFVLAYTGRAKLALKPTIDLAANWLSESNNLENAADHLKDQANKIMKEWYSHRIPSDVMVGFAGAGFVKTKEHGKRSLKPLRLMIANFKEENDTWIPMREFGVAKEALYPGQSFKLFVSGRPLSKERWSAINNIIKWCLRNKTARRPETIGRFLAREILRAAEKDEYIGKNIMCTFVPRDFVNDGSRMIHLGGVFLEKPIVNAEPQQLKPSMPLSLHDRFAFPPPFNRPRIVYIDNSNNALPYHSPIYVYPRQVIPSISISDIEVTIPPVIQTESV